MLGQSTMGKSCFKAMSTAIRRMLHHTHDLTMLLIKGANEESKVALGLVWKTAKEMTELPVSNKAACRRSIMQVTYPVN